MIPPPPQFQCNFVGGRALNASHITETLRSNHRDTHSVVSRSAKLRDTVQVNLLFYIARASVGTALLPYYTVLARSVLLERGCLYLFVCLGTARPVLSLAQAFVGVAPRPTRTVFMR